VPADALALPLRIEVARGIISQNKTQWAHWRVANRDKREWSTALEPHLTALRGLRLEHSSWHIVRIYGHGKRELDYGNLVGGAKPIPDCLKDFGVIKDDKPENFHCDYTQRHDPSIEGYKTLIILWELHVPSTNDIF
jgi:hypothetical protein